MRRLLATIATALAIIGVLAMTASADDAGALGYRYRLPVSSFDWAYRAVALAEVPGRLTTVLIANVGGLVQSNLRRLRTDRRCDADFRRRRSRIPARL